MSTAGLIYDVMREPFRLLMRANSELTKLLRKAKSSRTVVAIFRRLLPG
jgi:hypothetical protein